MKRDLEGRSRRPHCKLKKFKRDHIGESNNQNIVQENFPQEETRVVRSKALTACQAG